MQKSFAGAITILLAAGETTQEERALVAQGFAHKCSEINKKMPELSPREQDWVKAEGDAGRYVTLYGSVEFAKQQAKRALDNCELAGTNLRMAVGTDDNLEMYAWLRLVDTIPDWTLMDHMRTLKESSGAQITEENVASTGLFDMSAALIVRKILTSSPRGSGGLTEAPRSGMVNEA